MFNIKPEFLKMHLVKTTCKYGQLLELACTLKTLGFIKLFFKC